MKSTILKSSIAIVLLLGINSCKKTEVGEASGESEAVADVQMKAVSDSISYAATQQVKDKKFIRTAEVNMEVKNVYDATISIEKSLKEIGGFVTSSNMHSQVIEEDTYNTSDTEAVLVRKFQMENAMQVRVPSQNLGQFLQMVSDKKLFLNSRVISAEDVTANAKFAEMEGKRIKKTGENISTLRNNANKVNNADNNMSEGNYHELASMQMTDNIKYSTVDIYIREPKISVSTLAITNTKSIDNQYKVNFFYEMKNAMVDGFYMIQKLVIGATTIWPILLIGFLIYILVRKRRPVFEKVTNENQE